MMKLRNLPKIHTVIDAYAGMASIGQYIDSKRYMQLNLI